MNVRVISRALLGPEPKLSSSKLVGAVLAVAIAMMGFLLRSIR